MPCPLALNHFVMAGLVPAIHVLLAAAQKWMPGTGLQPGPAKGRTRLAGHDEVCGSSRAGTALASVTTPRLLRRMDH